MERRKLPSLNSLKSFEAVARNGSFTIAADELCVTQGAVSHQIKSLEQQIGLLLFDRDRSKVTLTKAGEVLLKATNSALNKMAGAIDEISNSVNAERQTIYVQASSQFSQFWLAPRIKEFLNAHKGVKILVGQSAPELSTTSATECVSITPDHVDAVNDRELLFQSDLAPMCSKKFVEESALGEGFLLCERSHDWWDDWSELHHPKREFGDGRLYFEDASLAVHTAVAGQGWMLGSEVVLDGLLTSGQLVRPLDPRNSLPRAYFLKWHTSGSRQSLARKFRSWLFDNSKRDPARSGPRNR